MTRQYFRPIKDKTIISTLHYMRQHIGREGLPGMEHVEALLEQWGVDPATLAAPRKTPKAFKRGELQRAILSALRNGPMTGAQVAERVGGNMDQKSAYKRVYTALSRMKVKGLVRHERRRWLAP